MEQKVIWPGWETVRLIGRGSFGAVYEIQRDVLGDLEKAALKVISIPQNANDVDELYADGFDEESITSAFQSHLKSIVAEYSLMRKMNGCTNIVNCDDIRYIQHEDGIGWDIFIKMELLTPLTKALPEQIPETLVVRLAKDMCTALELCKKHDIVHRDIKPQNIFVSPNGDYKLGDFGIAKTVEKTMGGTKIGTYKYMAPEVYNNQPYGSSADIYSLGLVLYWLLNEKRMPFMPLPPEKVSISMDEKARMRRLTGEALPAPAHGSVALQRIVLKACAYDPKERYASAADMARDLNRAFGGADFLSERELAEQERLELERIAREKAEQERIAREKAEQERIAREKAEQERFAREKAEQERIAREKAEQNSYTISAKSDGIAWHQAAVEVPEEKKKLWQKATVEDPEDVAAKRMKKTVIGVFAGLLVLVLVLVIVTSCMDRGPEIQSVKAVRCPEKLSYTQGQHVDLSGLGAVVTYEDGKSEYIDSGFDCSPSKLTSTGHIKITVSYKDIVFYVFYVDVLSRY